ncbi:MAG: cytochrome c oxidase subunit 3, partial [Gemmatimonadota bacterium]
MSAQSATYPMEQRPAPTKREPLVSNGVLGMLIFIFTEIMFFAGLISAHSIVRSQAAGQMWPPYGQPRLPVQETAVNTAALLASGIVLVIAWFAFR